MMMYLEGEEIDPDQIRAAIRKATLDIQMTPVFCGSAFKNKGVQPLLDGVVDYLPSPLDVPPDPGYDDGRRGDHARGRRERSAGRARLQGAVRPARREADVHEGVLGHAQGRLLRDEHHQGQARARRAPAAVARQQPRAARGGLRRRAGRGHRPLQHRHRRHAGLGRRPRADRARGDDLPGAGHRPGHRAEDQGRPGEAEP